MCLLRRVVCHHEHTVISTAGGDEDWIHSFQVNCSFKLTMLTLSLPAAALKSPVYRYLVTHTPSGPVNVSSNLLSFPSRFSFHCLDIISFFGGLEFILGKPLSAEDKNFQSLITRHLVHFAKTGPDTSCLSNGSTSALTNEDEGKALTDDCWCSPFLFLTGKMEAEWPEYPSSTALLSDRLTVVQDYSADRCRLWKENGLYAYAWVNWARTVGSVQFL